MLEMPVRVRWDQFGGARKSKGPGLLGLEVLSGGNSSRNAKAAFLEILNLKPRITHDLDQGDMRTREAR